MQLREARDLVDEIGAHVVAVGARESYQAQNLLDHGMPFDLLMDPDDLVRGVLGSKRRLPVWRLANPAGVMAYLRSLPRARRFFRVTPSQATQHPGVAVLDAQLNVVWTFIGQRIGDYPPLDVVLTELRRAI